MEANQDSVASGGVRLSVAQHLLHTLTDVGILGPARRGIRPMLPYAPSLLAVGWLALDLHARGATDSELRAHSDFGILQQEPHAVVELLLRLAEHGLVEVQAGVDLVQIAWPIESTVTERLAELPDVG